MRAFALTAPDQPAALTDLPDPTTPVDGVRIRVHAASVNGFDVFQAGGSLAAAMPHEYPTVIGRDFAGVVDEVGRSATADLAVGDDVFGFISATPPLHDGSFGEWIAGSSFVIAKKPAGMPWEVAAAIPLAGAAALDALEPLGVGAGDVVLVVGATGGVGSIALQLAARSGATVIATARSGPETELVRSLGASETVDYATDDVVDTVRGRYPAGIAALLDTVDRGEAFASTASLVREGGRVSTTLGAADIDALAGRGVSATNVRGNPTPERLALLAADVATGRLRIEIQRTYRLAEAPEAIAAFAAGTRGKIVLRIP